MSRSLYIFVGAHKTGSTFLHRELGQAEEALAAMDCHYDRNAVNYAKTLLARGCHSDPLTRRKVRQEMDQNHARRPEQNVILISEHFMGNPHTGYADAETLARGLADVCTGLDVKILISIRRQDFFVESWYAQSIKEGGFWTFDEYLATLPPGGLDWSRIVGAYEQAFGANKVRVVGFDQAFADPGQILDHHFAGWAYDGTLPLPSRKLVNPSLSPTVIEIARKANEVLNPKGKAEIRRLLEICAPKPVGAGFGLLSAEKRSALLTHDEAANRELCERRPELTQALSTDLPRPGSSDALDTAPPLVDDDPMDHAAVVIMSLMQQHYQAQVDAEKERVDHLSRQNEESAKLLSAARKKLAEITRRPSSLLVRGSLAATESLLRKVVEENARATAHQPVTRARFSNPFHDLKTAEAVAYIKKNGGRGKEGKNQAIRDYRQTYYARSPECESIQRLAGKHRGKRCFILGNGPSLATQNLARLKDEVTFVSNWFVNADQYHQIEPKYYCVSSHEMFGGWNKETPKLNEDYYRAMQTKARSATKFFSFAFRDYITQAGLFPSEDVRYLLFERPKQLVDELGSINLDLTRHLDDGYTVIQTMCIPLALHMGCTEIILLGCDCDYGIQKADDPKKYFYDAKLHKTATSKFESLQRIWADNGPVFQSYQIIDRALSERGVTLLNATNGGRLDVVRRVDYDTLFQ